jgi:hypothetical protein
MGVFFMFARQNPHAHAPNKAIQPGIAPCRSCKRCAGRSCFHRWLCRIAG